MYDPTSKVPFSFLKKKKFLPGLCLSWYWTAFVFSFFYHTQWEPDADRDTQTQSLRDHLVKRLQLTFEPSSGSAAENQWGASSSGETTPCWATALRATVSSQLHTQHRSRTNTHITQTQEERCSVGIQRNIGHTGGGVCDSAGGGHCKSRGSESVHTHVVYSTKTTLKGLN